MQQVAVSTASFCLWNVSPEEKLYICKELGCERVEVALSTVNMLKDFATLSSLPLKLAGFKNITIHIPWCRVKYGENATSKRIIDYLHEIDKRLQVEAYVIHFDTISDFNWLTKHNLNFYLENAIRHGLWPLFQKVLKNYHFNCVLDINRATRYEDYLDRIIEENHDNIKEIHVSGFINNMGRMPIRESKQEFLLDRVKQVNVPFIIEGLFSPGDIESIRKEIELIQYKTSCNRN